MLPGCHTKMHSIVNLLGCACSLVTRARIKQVCQESRAGTAEQQDLNARSLTEEPGTGAISDV